MQNIKEIDAAKIPDKSSVTSDQTEAPQFEDMISKYNLDKLPGPEREKILKQEQDKKRWEAMAGQSGYYAGGIICLPFANNPNMTIYMTSDFGGRAQPKAGASTNHKGIDIQAQQNGKRVGVDIQSCMPGEVIYAQDSGKGGNTVKVKYTTDAGKEIIMTYMHLNNIDVKVGDKLKAGDHIGGQGNSGNVTGPHVHLEMNIDGTNVDPIPYLTGQDRMKEGTTFTYRHPDYSAIVDQTAAFMGNPVKIDTEELSKQTNPELETENTAPKNDTVTEEEARKAEEARVAEELKKQKEEALTEKANNEAKEQSVEETKVEEPTTTSANGIDMSKISTSANGVKNGNFVKVNEKYFTGDNVTLKDRGDGTAAIYSNGTVIGFTIAPMAAAKEEVKDTKETSTPIVSQEAKPNTTAEEEARKAEENLKQAAELEAERKSKQDSSAISDPVPAEKTKDTEIVEMARAQANPETTSVQNDTTITEVPQTVAEVEPALVEAPIETPVTEQAPVEQAPAAAESPVTIEAVPTAAGNISGRISPGTDSYTHPAQPYNLTPQEYNEFCATVYAEASELSDWIVSDSLGVASAILNRADKAGGNVIAVMSTKGQFDGYGMQNTKFSRIMNNPAALPPEMKMAIDIALSGNRNTTYEYFSGDGIKTTFRKNL